MTPSLRTLKSFFCSKLKKLFVVHISVFIIFTLREKILKEKSYGNLFSMCFLWITLQVIVYLRDNRCQSCWIALMGDNSLVYCSAKPKGNICNIRYYILALHGILDLLCPVSKLDEISRFIQIKPTETILNGGYWNDWQRFSGCRAAYRNKNRICILIHVKGDLSPLIWYE